MRFIRLAAISLIAMASVAAAPRADWTTTVNPGDGGSHVLGNPAAKVKLTEDASDAPKPAKPLKSEPANKPAAQKGKKTK